MVQAYLLKNPEATLRDLALLSETPECPEESVL